MLAHSLKQPDLEALIDPWRDDSYELLHFKHLLIDLLHLFNEAFSDHFSELVNLING